MKLTIKIFLVITLFCSTAFADGDMNEGQRDGNSGGGGFACAECVVDDQEEKGIDNTIGKSIDESILESIKKFFGEIFG